MFDFEGMSVGGWILFILLAAALLALPVLLIYMLVTEVMYRAEKHRDTKEARPAPSLYVSGIKTNLIKLYILAALFEEDMRGADIGKKVKSLTNELLDGVSACLYRDLTAMREDKLIDFYEERNESGRVVNHYYILPAGITLLKNSIDKFKKYSEISLEYFNQLTFPGMDTNTFYHKK